MNSVKVDLLGHSILASSGVLSYRPSSAVQRSDLESEAYPLLRDDALGGASSSINSSPAAGSVAVKVDGELPIEEIAEDPAAYRKSSNLAAMLNLLKVGSAR